MPRAGRETRSIPIFSERNQKASLMATGPIGLAVFMRCVAIRRKPSPGCDEPLTWETTTIRGLCATRTTTSCEVIVTMNGCLPRFAITPINTGRNLALLLSEDCWVVSSWVKNVEASHAEAVIRRRRVHLIGQFHRKKEHLSWRVSANCLDETALLAGHRLGTVIFSSDSRRV